MPITQNIDLFRGDTKLLVIQVKDLLGVVFDLTGASVKWWLARNPDSIDGDVRITKSSAAGGGITIVSPFVGGTVQVQLNEHDTDLDPGIYYMELKVFKGTDIATSMRGVVYVRAALSMPAADPLLSISLVAASPVFGTPALVSV